jgi:hypothetical protein
LWKSTESQFQNEELGIKAQLGSLEDAKIRERLSEFFRTLELAQAAHSEYDAGKPSEKAKLAKSVLLNCSIDSVSLYPTYRKPFDILANRAKNEEWWT